MRRLWGRPALLRPAVAQARLPQAALRARALCVAFWSPAVRDVETSLGDTCISLQPLYSFSCVPLLGVPAVQAF